MRVSKTDSIGVLGEIVNACRFGIVMLIACGAIYSPLTTLMAKFLFPAQASGSLIEKNGSVVGSALVGQAFVSDAYFYGRPSAAGYDPTATSGSNLAPDNPELHRRAIADSNRIQALEQVPAEQIPAVLIAASGSGLDPHITPAAAQLQIPRVAKIRGMNEAELALLVERYTEGKQWGILGQPRINVLRLNLALDERPNTNP